MAKSPESKSELSTEKAAKFYRNFNIGAAAVTGAGIFVFPEVAPVFVGLTAINIAQAGLGEVVRQWRKNKSSSSQNQTPLPSAA